MFVGSYGQQKAVVPVGQKIIISSFGDGTTVIKKNSANRPGPDDFTFLANLTNSSNVYGPYTSDVTFEINAGPSKVEYVIGANPVLTSSAISSTDNSGSAGNTTINSLRGRAAFAAAGSTVTVTNSFVTANSTVLASLANGDATLKSLTVTPGAGSFVVNGNAAATGITKFDFLVFN